jgi:hypothetical protein
MASPTLCPDRQYLSCRTEALWDPSSQVAQSRDVRFGEQPCSLALTEMGAEPTLWRRKQPGGFRRPRNESERSVQWPLNVRSRVSNGSASRAVM